MTGSKAFTLVELITVLLIIALTLLFGIPALLSMINNVRAKQVSTRLVTAINYARQVAIAQSSVVTLCKSADAKTCSGAWRDGQLMFVDHNANHQVDAEDTLLKVYEPLARDAVLQLQSFSGQDYLQFYPLTSTHALNGTFIYRQGTGNNKMIRKIIVSKTGRVRVKRIKT